MHIEAAINGGSSMADAAAAGQAVADAILSYRTSLRLLEEEHRALHEAGGGGRCMKQVGGGRLRVEGLRVG
jgi:hypothetical protein